MRPALIRIEVDRAIGQIDPKLYGNFLEMMERAVYGGVYEPGSPLADGDGYRTDVLEAVRQLGVTVLRWPGGNFASAYHWADGTGPAAQRPLRFDPAWRRPYANTFGTPEFLRYCERVGAEPFLCINAGTGTLDEARDWVEYCNYDGPTAWAERRARDGRPEPHGVRYWGLGNEIYGSWQIGQKSAAEYVAFAREAAKAMRSVDPSIKLVSCGRSGWDAFDEIVLNGLADVVDLHSIHLYTGSPNHLENVALPLLAEKAILAAGWMIHCALARKGLDKRVTIAFDEWNVWYRKRGLFDHEEVYDLSDALAVAVYLNVFQRHCDLVECACLAQLVNVIAPILTSPQGLVRQTIYHPLAMYARGAGDTSLHASVSCDTYAPPASGDSSGGSLLRPQGITAVPYLDVSATRQRAAGTLTLFVVNRHPEAEIEARIEHCGTVPAGEAEVTVLTGPEPHATNTFAQPQAVTPAPSPPVAVAVAFRHAFPPLSLTRLQYRLE